MMDGLVETAIAAMGEVQPWDGWVDTALGGLRIRRIAHRRPFDCDLHGPLCGLVLQGGKEVLTGERRFMSTAGDAVIVSHHVPAVSRVVDGDRDRPYLALMLPLDMTLMGTLGHEMRGDVFDDAATRAIEAMKAGPEMLNAFARLLALVPTSVEARILLPMIVKEIHLRFLMAPQGAILRALLSRDSQASRISRVIAYIRQNASASYSVADLAGIAGMGSSSFHAHFKAVIGMTPLAFQKKLRLMQARNLLLDPEQNISSVAYAVGYESPTQFSREYSRRFGASPREHRETTRCMESELRPGAVTG